MEDEYENINCVRIIADLGVFDNPKNYLTNTPIYFRSGDSVRFDIVLFNNKKITDCSNIVSASFEIMDIGEINSPLPRVCKTLFKKTVFSDKMNKALTDEDISSGKCHFSIAMTSNESLVEDGNKYLKIYTHDNNGNRITFASGWIFVAPNFSATFTDSNPIKVDLLEQLEYSINVQAGRIDTICKDIEYLDLEKIGKSEILSHVDSLYTLLSSKANSGALHFYGGNIQCSGLANKSIPNVNSIAFRWKCDNNTYSKIEKNQRVFGYSASGGLSWYHLAKVAGSALQWYVKYEDNSQQYVSVTTATWESLIDGNWHNVEFISTGTAFEIWVDGVLKQSVARNNTANFATPASNFVVSYASSNIGEVADFCFFNFDMSADNAPYTIEDYQNGRAIPPSILDGTQTILALENYTITNGTSKIIFDYSGNNNDATIVGDVKGDNDKRITKLIDFIKA